MSAALRLDELIARLPGTIRRGYAPDPRAEGAACLSTGFVELDQALGGGVPRGRLVELSGRGSAGITSLAYRLAAGATGRAELVAWIDAADAFDPASASAGGIALAGVLWVRPPDLITAFAATEQLLALGGFALVVLDMATGSRSGARARRAGYADDESARTGERVPFGRRSLALGSSHAWIRLARAASRSRTALVALSRAASAAAGSSAAIRLELSPAQVVWDRAGGAPALLEGLVAQVAVTRNRGVAGERRLALRLG